VDVDAKPPMTGWGFRGLGVLTGHV